MITNKGAEVLQHFNFLVYFGRTSQKIIITNFKSLDRKPKFVFVLKAQSIFELSRYFRETTVQNRTCGMFFKVRHF